MSQTARLEEAIRRSRRALAGVGKSGGAPAATKRFEAATATGRFEAPSREALTGQPWVMRGGKILLDWRHVCRKVLDACSGMLPRMTLPNAGEIAIDRLADELPPPVALAFFGPAGDLWAARVLRVFGRLTQSQFGMGGSLAEKAGVLPYDDSVKGALHALDLGERVDLYSMIELRAAAVRVWAFVCGAENEQQEIS